MKYDVIVVGGGPAGVISAVTARKYYAEKKILMIKNVEKGVVPCGIPYMYSSLENPEDNAMGNMPLEKNNIEFIVDEVTEINKEDKKVTTKDGKTFEYDKLVLAIGGKPIVPPIDGVNKKGVWSIKKDLDYLKVLNEEVQAAKEVVVVGGGFIGVEFADELSTMTGKKVTLVEFMPEILSNSFDDEFSQKVHDKLVEQGVNVITGQKVVKFNGEEAVSSVSLSDGSEIPCQLVILGIGASPNSEIAKNANIQVGETNAIVVNEYMKSCSDDDIFAIGDCSQKKDFFTQKRTGVMLASTACAEARIAGANLFSLKVGRVSKGTIATYSTQIGNVRVASAGMTEKTAKKENFEIVTGVAQSTDKHPGKLKGTMTIDMKLIFSKESGVILGGQISGGESIGEMINIIGMAIQKGTTITELEILQIATHPKLSAAPTMYPIITAAQNAISKMN